MHLIESTIWNIFFGIEGILRFFYTLHPAVVLFVPDYLHDLNASDLQDETGSDWESPSASQVPNVLLQVSSPPTEYPTTTPTQRFQIQFNQVFSCNCRPNYCLNGDSLPKIWSRVWVTPVPQLRNKPTVFPSPCCISVNSFTLTLCSRLCRLQHCMNFQTILANSYEISKSTERWSGLRPWREPTTVHTIYSYPVL